MITTDASLRSLARAAIPSIAVVAAAAMGALMARQSLAVLSILFVAAVASLYIWRPLPFLMAVLAARPVLDVADNVGTQIPGFSRLLNLNAALSLVIIGGSFAYALVRVRTLRLDATAGWFGVFAGLAALSLLPSIDRSATMVDVLKLLSYGCVYVVLVNELNTARDGYLIVGSVFAATIIPVAASLYQAINRLGVTAPEFSFFEYTRTNGTFVEPVSEAIFLLIPLTLAICLCLAKELRQAERVLYLGFICLCLPPFYLTLARGPWIGFIVGLFVIGLVRKPWLAIGLPVLLALVLIAVPDVLARFSTISTDAADASVSSVANRLVIWRASISLFLRSPIWGSGFGAANLEAGRLAFGYGIQTHNDYLRLLADVGVVGFVTNLLLMGAVLARSWRSLLSTCDVRLQHICLGFVGVWVALMVIRISDNTLTNSISQFTFWGLAGVVAACPRWQTRMAPRRG